ncbi:hypothetical protein HK101_006491 [Irineochytrium annulatum]|nr:hypothetical protein HK101_006491 [Irineochytrium annulatum]
MLRSEERVPEVIRLPNLKASPAETSLESTPPLRVQQATRQPLAKSPSSVQAALLDGSVDTTPHVGTELHRSIQLKDLLAASNSDELLRALAVLVSERCVVFLRDQDLTHEQQKEVVNRIASLAGRPNGNGLHVHPIHDGAGEDVQIQVIGNNLRTNFHELYDRSELASAGWHSDLTFEPAPSDYALLKIHTLPATGGDTLWASSYEVYDRLSPAMRAFLETLTATHSAAHFREIARVKGVPVRSPRGAPENAGDALTAVHPVIRTHPVTGWKLVFVNPAFTVRINELSNDESAVTLKYIYGLVSDNHDLQGIASS